MARRASYTYTDLAGRKWRRWGGIAYSVPAGKAKVRQYCARCGFDHNVRDCAIALREQAANERSEG